MFIRFGFDMVYDCTQPTPMILALNVRPSLRPRLLVPDRLFTDKPVRISGYQDSFGNWCSRIVAPVGRLRLMVDAIIQDSGAPEPVMSQLGQLPVEALPDDTLVYLLGSRYCETDLLSNIAWNLFGNTPPGWSRVQAICDWVHQHIQFGYQYARSTKTAWEVYNEGRGVCRDFAHLAVAFCRCMNIPARYCTGYLGDIGVPPVDAPMDFAAYFEAYLDGKWCTFDPRNNQRRIGRLQVACGRDAADVAIANTFGTNFLSEFRVWTDEVDSNAVDGPDYLLTKGAPVNAVRNWASWRAQAA
ncbi:MAG: transglutaminase family protein [Burkholderiaceae bacterium]|jgi:transglutaminase-like putative cysteine protease